MTEHSHAAQQKKFYDTQFKKIASPKMEENIRNFYFRKMVAILEEHGIAAKQPALFEIGVGTGALMKKMREHFHPAIIKGVDISENNIRIAWDQGLDVAIANANDLSITGQYDLIYGTAILHHLENIPQFFAQIHAMLKPGGAILFGAEPVASELFYILYHKMRGSWEIEKGMLNISVRAMQRHLTGSYKNIHIYRHGNPFVYCSHIIGMAWNTLRLSTLPFLNDIYIYAEKQ